MTRAALLRFLGMVTMTVVVAHVGVAAAAAIAMRQLYPHRILNVRAWNTGGAERFQLVGSFLQEHGARDQRPLVGFIGSSVTYGYPWDERLVFSRLFADQKPDYKVLNSSLMAASMSGIHDFVLCAAARNGTRFDTAVIEIPVVNSTSEMAQRYLKGQPQVTLQPCGDGAPDPGYFQLALAHPRGIGWLRVLSATESNEVRDAVAIGPVPPGYFVSRLNFQHIRRDYIELVAASLRKARQIAQQVYAFPSPVFVGGLSEAGEDTAAMQQQLDATVEACRNVPEIACIDTAQLWTERSNYYNYTHLNQNGHRALAAIIAAAVASPTPRDAPVH